MVDAQELARLVAEFGKTYTRRIWAEIGRTGTTPARARLLAVLQCHGSRKMSELGAELGVTPRNITKLVDGLEAEGLVARKAHPSDRRATLVSLTDKGALVGKRARWPTTLPPPGSTSSSRRSIDNTWRGFCESFSIRWPSPARDSSYPDRAEDGSSMRS